ncbi:hypothetical protein C8R44DRAFT_974329 [Mycena epipterygia]|nr:hypothetical protein C8R44DRAFT_974329 [Mycena epipterygia]
MDADSAAHNSETTLERSPDIWFDDGTIVLRAGRTLFRVFRGILAAQSPIFRDTFAIPQPPTQEMYDACAVLEIQDSPKDLRMLLMATHDPTYATHTPVDGLETLSALLRLSTKYEIDHIRTRMISILKSIYPNSLDAWISRVDPPGYLRAEGDEFKALVLASTLDVPDILPGVFFLCSRNTVHAILAAEIPLGDKQKCLEGLEALMIPALTLRFLFGVPADCINPNLCNSKRLSWLRQFGGIPFRILEEKFEWQFISLCRQCRSFAEEQLRGERLQVWDALPGLFEINEKNDR